MTEKIYLENFKKCPGSLRFPLLMCGFKILTVAILADTK